MKYSYRQRRAALIVVILADVLFRVPLFFIPGTTKYEDEIPELVISVLCVVINLVLVVLCCRRWRLLKSAHLNKAAICCWLVLMTHSIIDSVSYLKNGLLWFSVWYGLTTIFIPYTMFPLSLCWSVAAGYVSVLTHLILVAIKLFADDFTTYVSPNDTLSPNTLQL